MIELVLCIFEFYKLIIRWLDLLKQLIIIFGSLIKQSQHLVDACLQRQIFLDIADVFFNVFKLFINEFSIFLKGVGASGGVWGYLLFVQLLLKELLLELFVFDCSYLYF